MRSKTALAGWAVLALVATGCGDDGGEPAASEDEESAMLVQVAEGEPADVTVAVEMSEFAFTHDPVDIAAGQVVTFEFTNVGEVEHEAVLALAHEQAELAESHEEEAEGDEGHEEGVVEVEVEPGDSADLTVRFTEPGDFAIGCHLPGHFEAGMVSPLTVS